MATKRVFKTKKKVSGSRGTFRKWSEWTEGDVVVGKFVSQGEDQYENPSWTIEVIEATFSDRKLAKSLAGKNLILNSAGQLNKAMEKVEEGQLVQITYNGTSEIEKGKFKGKDAHLMDVEIVEEDDGSDDEVDFDEDEETEESADDDEEMFDDDEDEDNN